jgi:hypothetical protein
MCDLLWSDPEAKVGDWGRSDHGKSVLWGLRPATKFLNPTGLQKGIELPIEPKSDTFDSYEFSRQICNRLRKHINKVIMNRNDENENRRMIAIYTLNMAAVPLLGGFSPRYISSSL